MTFYLFRFRKPLTTNVYSSGLIYPRVWPCLCINAIERYLETRDDAEKPLFLSRKKRGIPRNQVNQLVKKYAVVADLRTYKEHCEVKTKVGPHTLRYTAVTNLIPPSLIHLQVLNCLSSFLTFLSVLYLI